MKIALCTGLNLYPDPRNNLRGCVPDALAFTEYFKNKKHFDSVTTILDKNAKFIPVVTALKDAIASCNAGDHFVWTNSSHGSQGPDKNGDESDRLDECICLYDKFLYDDDIRTILDTAKPGVSITIVSDSCFSGTVTRQFFNDSHDDVFYRKPRYMVPTDKNVLAAINKSHSKKRLFRGETAEKDMKEILISGCSDKQYSADAYFNGKFSGALTYHMLDILNNATIDLTYNQFYIALRSRLPSDTYEQIPQLEGSEENKNKIMFS